MVVGRSPIILKNEYDPDQLWFPFMEGTTFLRPETPVQLPARGISPRNKRLRREKIQISPRNKRLRREKIHIDNPRMYHYTGLPQFDLPFHEKRLVTKHDYHGLGLADWPGWDRHNGELLMVDLSSASKDEILEWCGRNAQGRYHVSKSFAVFQCENDFILAKIGFQKAG